jgi:hypothetical protein
MTLRYAINTKVTVEETIHHVAGQIARYGGDRFKHLLDPPNKRAVFVFDYRNYTISFGFPIPDYDAQERRRIYRAALLAIKAKLESVASGIESPAQAFMAHIVTENGQLMFDKARNLLPYNGK